MNQYGPMNQLERDEEQLDRDLHEGRISQAEYNKQLRDLQREYRDDARGAAEDAARDAYDNELGHW